MQCVSTTTATPHGDTGNQAASNAPIDGGLSILLAMGAAYGGKKLCQARKEKHEDEQEEKSLQE